MDTADGDGSGWRTGSYARVDQLWSRGRTKPSGFVRRAEGAVAGY